MGSRVLQQSHPARRRAARQVRRQPDHHQAADRQDPVPGFGGDRGTPQGLDAEMARNNGLGSVPWLLVAAPMAVLLLFFALPNALLLSASFLKSEAQQLTHELTLE